MNYKVIVPVYAFDFDGEGIFEVGEGRAVFLVLKLDDGLQLLMAGLETQYSHANFAPRDCDKTSILGGGRFELADNVLTLNDKSTVFGGVPNNVMKKFKEELQVVTKVAEVRIEMEELPYFEEENKWGDYLK